MSGTPHLEGIMTLLTLATVLAALLLVPALTGRRPGVVPVRVRARGRKVRT